MRKLAAKTNKASLPVSDAEVVADAAVIKPEQEPCVKEVIAVAEVAEPAPASESPRQPADAAVTVGTAPAEQGQADSPKPAKQGKARKVETKKAKLIRDSFTFPEFDYALFAILKKRALDSGREIKKSELLRAGLNALNAISEEEFLKVLDGVERIKTGRPSK